MNPNDRAGYFYKGKHRLRTDHSAKLPATAIAGTIAVSAMVGIGTTGVANAAPDEAWDRLAQCESSGNWAINSGNGYSGGLQFLPSTWDAYRPDAFPTDAHKATREQQILVAERVLAGQGWGAWPSCSTRLGLRGLPVNLREIPTRAPSTPSQTPNPPTTSPTPTPSNVSEEETPSSSSTPTPTPRTQTPAYSTIPITTDTYTIVDGDILSAIALRLPEGISWTDIYNANLAVVEDPDLIYPGEVLQIPEPTL